MPKGKKRDPDGFPCLVVTFEEAPTLNDTQKYVRFINGVGVLDKPALEAQRPDWFQMFSVEKIAGLVLEYKRYWRDKGAKVDVVDEETAAKVRAELENVPVEKPKPKKETLDDLKGQAEAEVDARADKPEADGEDSDEGKDDPLPHQQ